mmetsp:Transcript_62983/g.150025  ORF Transcript_62983/g.150025 Transcript_62983/m.150025 type:complete len:242 (-) Transcript_62983:113-838(-)
MSRAWLRRCGVACLAIAALSGWHGQQAWTAGPTHSSRSLRGLERSEVSHAVMHFEDADAVKFNAAPVMDRLVAMAFASLAGMLLAVSSFTAPAAAADKRMVGEIPASGLVFKDMLNVEEFEDPKVSGVKLYLSDFSRSLADRIAKNDFFSDPGAAGLTCTSVGPVKVSPDLKPNKEGEDVFNESRSILFKTLKVKRLYDQEGKVVVYVVFTDRAFANDDSNKSRYKSQLCAVPVDGVMEKK